MAGLTNLQTLDLRKVDSEASVWSMRSLVVVLEMRQRFPTLKLPGCVLEFY